MLKFEQSTNPPNIIKVIGVGGGGSNAVTHMFRQGIKGVDFIVCNTDAQAMETSQVPVKIQLGKHLTGGLGAGAVPSVGRNAALETSEEIREVLAGTRMLFITAGLGGGTGTGAAPVIAEVSRELGILTVGIVTIPFAFEGRKRKLHADEGIRQMKEQVDALLIISNDKLRELFGNLRLSEAFGQADNVLTTAARGIAEIITVTGYINVDFEDVKTVMKDSGVAIMGTGIATGEHRAQKAVEQAISSPLLNNNDIEGANNLLLYIASGTEEITMDEVTEITDFIQMKTKSSTEVIWGNGFDERLGNNISVTIIATGFDEEHRQKGETGKKIVMDLYKPEIEPPRQVTMPDPEIIPAAAEESMVETEPETVPETAEPSQREIVFELDSPKPEPIAEPEPEIKQETFAFSREVETLFSGIQKQPKVPVTEPDRGVPGELPGLSRQGHDRVEKLKALSEKLKNHTPIENNLYELENTPAYKRRNVELTDVAPSSANNPSLLSLSDNPETGGIELRNENSFLHKNVD
jgi:cell division protein FtsZ